MPLAEHPEYPRILARLRRWLPRAVPFQDHIFRMINPQFSSNADILDGAGGLRADGRWNVKGRFRCSYASQTPETAMQEVLVATRLSLGLAMAAVLIGVVSGTVLGTAPAVLPRWAGRIISTFVNIAVAFPGLLLALFLAVIFGVGTVGSVLAIGFAMAPAFARLTQTLSAAIAGRDFIAAARVAGVSRFRVLVRHILPNIGEPLIVNATIINAYLEWSADRVRLGN